MRQISAEILMAYVDGELSEPEKQEVDAYLASNPSAQEQLKVFADTGRDLGRLFDGVMDRPLPGAIVKLVLEHPIGASNGALRVGTRRSGIGRSLVDRLQTLRFWPAVGAMPAVMLVGGVIGYLLHAIGPFHQTYSPLVELRGAALVAGQGLSQALDEDPSGKLKGIKANGATFSVCPVLTFAHVDGRYCRQIKFGENDGHSFEGIACRTVDGRWQIEGFDAITTMRCEQRVLGAAGAAHSNKIEKQADEMANGDPLGPDEERKLIAEKWGQGQSPKAP